MNYGNNQRTASFTTNSHGNHGMAGDERRILPKGDSFDAKNVEFQLAVDESLAISLQEKEYQALRSSPSAAARSETTRTASGTFFLLDDIRVVYWVLFLMCECNYYCFPGLDWCLCCELAHGKMFVVVSLHYF